MNILELLTSAPVEIRVGGYLLKVTVEKEDVVTQPIVPTDSSALPNNIWDSGSSNPENIPVDKLISTIGQVRKDEPEVPYQPSVHFFMGTRLNNRTYEAIEQIVKWISIGKDKVEITDLLDAQYYTILRYRKILGHLLHLVASTSNHAYLHSLTFMDRTTLAMIKEHKEAILLFVGHNVYYGL